MGFCFGKQPGERQVSEDPIGGLPCGASESGELTPGPEGPTCRLPVASLVSVGTRCGSVRWLCSHAGTVQGTVQTTALQAYVGGYVRKRKGLADRGGESHKQQGKLPSLG